MPEKYHDVALRPHQEYTEVEMKNFLFQCRYLANNNPNSPQSYHLSMVVSSLRPLNELGPSLIPGQSPWYNQYYYEPLKLFTPKEVDSFWEGISMTEELRQAIDKIAGGNPALLQNAGFLLSNQLQAGQTPDPEQFVADFLARTEHLFQQTWQLCNEEEQTLLILIALLALKGRWQNQEYQLGDMDLIFSQHQRELEDLARRGVIISTEGEKKKIYTFASSLMEWWTLQQINKSNNLELEGRQKVFLRLMSHKQAEQVAGSIRYLWQHRDVVPTSLKWIGNIVAALPQGLLPG